MPEPTAPEPQPPTPTPAPAPTPAAEAAPPMSPVATAQTVAGARPWIPVLFLLSGAAGLLYEVLWSKYLGFLLGNAAHANALVLGTFLGGLALGSALLGRYADRVPNQLYLYAWLELGVALLAGLTPTAFGSLEAVVGGLGPAARAALAAAVLLPPTLLMGGTLPALSRFLTREIGGVQGHVARLYFLNSAGAVAGGLLAGFWLVPRLGLDASVYVGAFTNVAIGLLAMYLAKQGLAAAVAPADEATLATSTPAAAPAAAAPEAPDADDLEPVPPALRTYALAAIFISGFVALTYEVAWIRLLALILGSSTYSFTLMLAAFVTGIALGALLVERGLTLGRTPLARFALAELGVAVGVLLTLPLYERLPYWFLHFKAMLAPTAAAFPLFEAGKFAFCFLLMLVPTVFLGMTLPLATRLVTARRSEVGAKVGEIFAANTLGNVLGAAAATLVLLPMLGIKGVIDLGVLVNLLVAAGAAWLTVGWPTVRRVAVTALPLAIFGLQRALAPGLDMQVLSAGVFRESVQDLPPTYAAFKARFAGRTVLFNKDDANTTVTVAREGENVYLSLNGKVDASSAGDLATQVLSGQLPLLLRPASERMLVIGYGSGITAGAALTHPIKQLDMAEISPAVLEAGRFFAPFNHDVQNDGRFRALLEDGLALLRVPGPTYDVIVTEPSNSWMAGVGNLFTVDAYRLMARRLAPDGLVVQWLPLYETDDETLRLILRSFRTVFPHATLWQTQALDTVIVGSRMPIDPDFAAFERRAAEPGVAAELRRAGLSQPAALLMMQLATPKALALTAQDGELNTLRFPRLEYRAPVAFYADATANAPYKDDVRLLAGGAADPDHLLTRYLAWRKRPVSADEFAEYAAYQAAELPLNAYRGVDAQILREWRRAYPGDHRATIMDAQRLAGKGQVSEALALVEPIAKARPADPALATFVSKLHYTQAMTGWGFLTKQPPGVAPAAAAIERALSRPGADAVDGWSRLAALRHVAGDRPGEFKAVEQALAALAKRPSPQSDALKLRLLATAATTALDAGELSRARAFLEPAWALDSTDEELGRLIRRYDAAIGGPGVPRRKAP